MAATRACKNSLESSSFLNLSHVSTSYPKSSMVTFVPSYNFVSNFPIPQFNSHHPFDNQLYTHYLDISIPVSLGFLFHHNIYPLSLGMFIYLRLFGPRMPSMGSRLCVLQRIARIMASPNHDIPCICSA